MAHRIVTISKPSWLKKDTEHLIIEQDGNTAARIPIEDIAVLILDSYGITLTHELIVALNKNNTAVVHCDERHLPISCIVPFEANAIHAKTLRQQIECTAPKKKQLWKHVVQAKIIAQAQTLEACHPGNRTVSQVIKNLQQIAKKVKAGDPENLEAQAAAHYFPALFGNEFIRDRELPGTNAALNYGYAILRAMVARALVGAGLHPALGIHHRGPENPFNLADDAIEPLRPFVDEAVIKLDPEWLKEPKLPKEAREDLLKITVLTVKIAGKPLQNLHAMERYAASWREALCGNARRIAIPSRMP